MENQICTHRTLSDHQMKQMYSTQPRLGTSPQRRQAVLLVNTQNCIRCTNLAVQCPPSSYRHHGACLSRIPSLSEWHPFWPGIQSPLAWPCPDLAARSESVEVIRKWGVLVIPRHASIQARNRPCDGMDRNYTWATLNASMATSQWLGIMYDWAILDNIIKAKEEAHHGSQPQ